MTEYEICQVPTYKVKYDNSKKTIKPIDTIKAVLLNDLQLHERLNENDLLKMSVDIDKLTEKNKNATKEKVFQDICEYVGIDINDISYTTNFSVESGSHHVVIPKYFMKSVDQKKYWYNFRNKYGYGKEIDADIFGKNGWFRLPNQTKEGKEGTEHIIQQGQIQDFVLKYVENSTEYPGFLQEKQNTIKLKTKSFKEIKPKIIKTEDGETDDDNSTIISNPLKDEGVINEIKILYKKIIDFEPFYFDEHKRYISLAYTIFNETQGNQNGLTLLKEISAELPTHEYNNEFNQNRFWFQAKPKGDKQASLKTLRKIVEDVTGEELIAPDKIRFLEANVIKSDEYLFQRKRFEKKHFKINKPLVYCGLTNEDGLCFYKETDMAKYCIDKFPTFRVLGGMGVMPKPFFELWLKDPEKRQYAELVFDPKTIGEKYLNDKPTYEETEDGEKIFINYNMFYGFKHDLSVGKCDETQSKFLDLLKYVCNNDEIYEYMKCWFATIIQKPYKKTNVGVVFYSEVGGVGKNAIVDGAIKLFEGYDAHIEDIEDITKKFNAHLCNKLFVYGDEITARAKAVSDKLKGVITRPTCNMEKKGFDIIPLNDYINWLFTTNNETAFKIEKDDRRMFMIKCVNIPKDTEYYTAFYEYINNKQEVSKLFNFFKEYDCKAYPDIGKGRVPKTAYKKELEYENASPIERFIFQKIKVYANKKFTSSGFRELIDEFAKKNYLPTSYSVTKYGTEMRKYFDKFRGATNGTRTYDFKNVSANEIRKHLLTIDEKYYRYITGILPDEPIIFPDEHETEDEFDIDCKY